MTYRNIYFHTTSPMSATGTEIVKYTGNIFTNACNIKNIGILFDKNKDLYITCNECASKKYKAFIKSLS